MCLRCIKRAKNYSKQGKTKEVKIGLLKALTYRYLNGESIPLFGERAANFVIEENIEKMKRVRSKYRYNRKKYHDPE